MMINGLSSAAVGVAYLTIDASFLRRYRRAGDSPPSSDALRYVVTALCLCVLMHVDDILTFYRPSQSLLASVSLLGSVAALTAVSGRPRFLRALAARYTADRCGHAPRGEAEAPDRAESAFRAEAERYERLRARALELEITFRRDAWLDQCRLAVSQLNELLDARPPASVGADPAVGATEGRPT